MSLINTGKSPADLEESVPVAVPVGDATVALCKVGGQVRAVQNGCPHQGYPLAEGIWKEERVICSWHGWGFSADSGQCDFNPAVILKRFKVVEQEGTLWVDLEVTPEGGTPGELAEG